ncbi:polyamine-modulated factor 1-binding protein 1 isoform X21 [Danio rerio]
MQEVWSSREKAAALQKELSRLQVILKHREELIEENNLKTTQLQRDTDCLHKQASCREATLRCQDSELIELKAGLQEAEKMATDAEARLQPLTESLQICKHKYQTCLSKIAQLQNTLHSQEEDLKEAHSQVALREEQLLHLRAQVVCLQEDLQVHRTQLETGDDAITTLSQKLRDTERELEHSRKHTQECELLISTHRDTAEKLQRQVEDQEETLVKMQADFSIYRATHIHSDSDYESQLSRVQELEHALFQSLERCGHSAQELRVCQLEMARHKDCSPAEEMQRLQEQLRKLQADAADEVHRQAQVDSLEQKVANLEGELQAAQRQCDQAIQKRDALLRQSEADLLQARDKIRGRAAEAERQAAAARGLEADLQRAKKEKRQKEKECASLKTQLLQLREQLKEANTTCRDTGQELMRQQEKLQLLEGGQRLTQDQLSERVAELLEAEKAHRKLQAELKRTTDSLENTQLELQDSRSLLEHLKAEVSSSRQDLLGAQHEAAKLQQEKQQIREELNVCRESLLAMQSKARACEGRLAELHTQLSHSEQWAQQQTRALQDREEELLMLKMEMVSLRENYTATLSQVEVLNSQMDSVNQKYSSAVCEADVLRQCLGDARTDSSRLHRESELVVTNVNQWVKEQKHTNEKLALKIKEQSRKIIHLTAERDHLQENVKGLQGEIRRLKTRENGGTAYQVMKAEEDEALPVCLD